MERQGNMKKLAVLMPVFNGNDKHLRLSIESILSQTFADYEFVIVNDGSSEEISSILSEYAELDRRILLVENKKNLGIVDSLNNGLKKINTVFVARHDADDIADPDRLRIQLEFMEQNPDITACFTSANIIDPAGKFLYQYSVSECSRTLAIELLFNSRLRHPTLMARKTAYELVGGYKNGFPFAEDHKLFCSFVEHNCLMAGIDKPLIDYRLDLKSNSREKDLSMWSAAEQVSFDYSSRFLNLSVKREAFKKFWFLLYTNEKITPFSFAEICSLKKLIKAIKMEPKFKEVWWKEFEWRVRSKLRKNLVSCLMVILIMKLS